MNRCIPGLAICVVAIGFVATNPHRNGPPVPATVPLRAVDVASLESRLDRLERKVEELEGRPPVVRRQGGGP